MLLQAVGRIAISSPPHRSKAVASPTEGTMRRRGGMGGAGKVVLVAGLWFTAARAWGQTSAAQAQMAADSLFVTPAPAYRGVGAGEADTSVCFIDTALPLSQLRLRYDDVFRDRRPTRAEYL